MNRKTHLMPKLKNTSRLDSVLICGQRNQRNKHDYYSTPPYVMKALVDTINLNGLILDPCCGKGEMGKFFKSLKYKVVEIDINADNHGYGVKDDFLNFTSPVDNIVANPPFSHALEFIEHSLRLARKKVCMVTRLAFLETSKRHTKLFKVHPPATIILFSKRIDFRDNNNLFGGGFASVWVIWDQEHKSHKTNFVWYNN